MWIAFKIVLLLMIPNKYTGENKGTVVVNCFQNCTFTYDSQHTEALEQQAYSCELLSKLYFYLWFPTKPNGKHQLDALWIAFKIVLLLMIPNLFTIVLMLPMVVNCFQNCTFTYDSQQVKLKKTLINCCELLSKLYFYLWFPTRICFDW